MSRKTIAKQILQRTFFTPRLTPTTSAKGFLAEFDYSLRGSSFPYLGG